MISKRRNLYIGIVWLISLLTHFIFFGRPNQTVFDEVHFGKFISAYYTHEYYFDIHPPLGKLIIYEFGRLFNFSLSDASRPKDAPNAQVMSAKDGFAQIGDKFPDKKYMALRFLPALAGSLLPPVAALLALEMGMSTLTAVFIGIFLSLDNALITQSRLILLDSFLLLFGFSALWLYFRYRNTGRERFLVLMGIAAGLSFSIKWTGLSFLALAGLAELYQMAAKKDFKRLSVKFFSFAALPLIIYFSVFAVHFSLLTKSGSGDAFMTAGFQKTLAGNQYADDPSIKTPNLFQKFVELNTQMYSSNQHLTAKHPYGSQWYTWPFMTRPIFYWVSDGARIYLMGNPAVWWISTAAVLALMGFLITNRDMRKEKTAWLLLGGYALNMLPFIGIHRVMFLYHYLAGLVFAVIVLGFLLEKTVHQNKKIFAGMLLLALAVFVFFAPLTYGLPLTDNAYQARVWLPSWQ